MKSKTLAVCTNIETGQQVSYAYDAIDTDRKEIIEQAMLDFDIYDDEIIEIQLSRVYLIE